MRLCSISTFTFPAEKKCIFSHCFIQNWEQIESFKKKNEKNPGIVLEKPWNSVFPFPYKPFCIESHAHGRQVMSTVQ